MAITARSDGSFFRLVEIDGDVYGIRILLAHGEITGSDRSEGIMLIDVQRTGVVRSSARSGAGAEVNILGRLTSDERVMLENTTVCTEAGKAQPKGITTATVVADETKSHIE